MEPLSSQSRENFFDPQWKAVLLFEGIFHNENFECSHHGNISAKMIRFNYNRLCFLRLVP